MKILKQQCEAAIIGKLEVMTRNLYLPDLAIYTREGNSYHNFAQVKKIEELLKKQGDGFRVAAKKDFEYLSSLGSCWCKQGKKSNVYAGRLFGNKNKEGATVFLPAVGYYCYNIFEKNYSLVDYGSCAAYWSSTYYDDRYSYYLSFDSDMLPDTSMVGANDYGRSIRCVRNFLTKSEYQPVKKIHKNSIKL
ncbi:MAG: hypothetical protein LBG80_06505 [Bacteroidales bacterium]|jgi:uncharacterized protein (TIGR02145 family)|nr:hypothetical protein [Bacteroidales bacterium]